MIDPAGMNRNGHNPFLKRWLMLLALLVFAMVVVGGATRLTGSGLSITEWRPVTGAIPPLSLEAWLSEFEKYRQSPQYALINQGMSLGEFQFIYWWEWGHRQLGRFIGLVYLGGFLFAAIRGYARGGLLVRLFLMGLLLGLQGAVGWIMVASGLQPGMSAVAPVKLTLHLGLATLFFGTLVATLVKLSPARTERGIAAFRGGAKALLLLVFGQILLGGLVAGSRAGLSYNTWPLMDGALLPPAGVLFAVSPWYENFVDNIALVQFDHRVVAYLLLGFALWHAWRAGWEAPGTRLSRRARALAGLVAAQAALGVATLVLVVPLWAGLAHQALAMLVFGMAVAHVCATGRDSDQAERA